MTSRAFSVYGHPLKMVPYFKYLGRVLSASDDDWPEVIRNLTKAWAVWQRMLRILSMERARLRVSIFFFKSIIQLVLLFGVETWVVTSWMRRVLGFFKTR